MKTNHFITATVIGLLFLGSISLNAQTTQGTDKNPKRETKQPPKKEMHQGWQGHQEIPGLTEDQKTKIKNIHLDSYKELKSLQNQLGELKAKERTLTTADKPDMDAINANIDDMTKIQNKIMKSQAATHQQIRALLTDEQKIRFDSHKGNFGKRQGLKGFGPSQKGPQNHDKPEDHMQPNN